MQHCSAAQRHHPSRACLSNQRYRVIVQQGLFSANNVLVFYRYFHTQFIDFPCLKSVRWNMKAAKSKKNRRKSKMKLSKSCRENTAFSFMSLQRKKWNINCLLKTNATCSAMDDGFNHIDVRWHFSVGGILSFILNTLLVVHIPTLAYLSALSRQQKSLLNLPLSEKYLLVWASLHIQTGYYANLSNWNPIGKQQQQDRPCRSPALLCYSPWCVLLFVKVGTRCSMEISTVSSHCHGF